MTLSNRTQSLLQDLICDYMDTWGGYDALDPENQEAITQIWELIKK